MVIAGSVSHIPSGGSSEEFDSSYSRPWLAAELLCTWRWQGGCASESLLPYLNSFEKSNMSYSRQGVIHSIVHILIDGAVMHGADSETKLFNVWHAFDEDADNIQNPFLRALISLLSTLLLGKHERAKVEALLLFECFVDKLTLGTMTNRSCLQVLPFVLNILMQLLRSRIPDEDGLCKNLEVPSARDNRSHELISGWIRTAHSFPPLLSVQPSGLGEL